VPHGEPAFAILLRRGFGGREAAAGSEAGVTVEGVICLAFGGKGRGNKFRIGKSYLTALTIRRKQVTVHISSHPQIVK